MISFATTSSEAMSDKTSAPDSLAYDYGLMLTGNVHRYMVADDDGRFEIREVPVLGWVGPNPDEFDQELEMRAASYERSSTKDSSVYFALVAAGVEVEK